MERKTKNGRTFYGCSRFPECKYALWDRPIAKSCPLCGAPFIVEKKKKDGSYQKCIREGCNYSSLDS
jgi:DNA topoisomerase-1